MTLAAAMLASTLTLPGHFEIPSEIVVVGIITGITYALFALGITLVYQSSRVLNFAQGAMGALPHIMVASLVIDHGMSYWLVLPLALLVAAGSGALLELGVIRRLRHAPRLVVLVATIGAAQLLQVPGLRFVDLNHTKMGHTFYPVPLHASLQVGSVKLTGGHLLILLVAPVIVAALTFFLRGTSVGLAARAVADNDEAASLSGVPTGRVSLVVWSLSGLLAGVAAILAGPTKPILAVALGGGGIAMTSSSTLLLRGLGAAMIGGLTSMPQVFAAGLGIGVVEALVNWNYASAGTADVVIAVLVVGSLLVRRDLRKAATRGGEEANWTLSARLSAVPDHIRRLPRVRAARLGAVLIALLGAVVLPLGSSRPQLVLYSAICVYVIIALSLVVLSGWAGQVSLGHFTFVALGAIVGGRLHQLGYPAFGSIGLTLLFAAVASLVVGLPALRMRGLFLAVTTLAFAVAFDSWVPRQTWIVRNGASGSSLYLPRPHWFGIDFAGQRAFYYLMLTLAIAVFGLVVHLRNTGIGRSFIAVRDNEPMASSLSLAPSTAKLSAFVLSGVVAAFAGYFYGTLLQNFGSAGLSNPMLGQTMIVMVILGGATSPLGGVLGALYVRGLPYVFHSPSAQLLSSGLGVLVVLLFIPGGLASLAYSVRDRFLRWIVPDAWAAAPEAPPTDVATSRVRLGSDVSELGRPAAVTAAVDEMLAPPPIACGGIGVRFGGIAALSKVTIHASHGEIVGLLGPNGAGKTTLFDVLSGQLEPNDGTVWLKGEDITALPPSERAHRGLARSFQQARLFEDLTVMEAFQVALERVEPSELVPSLLSLPPSRAAERAKRARAADLVELLGLQAYANRKAVELSTGTRRIAELGCAVALQADVLLLDEPTSGIAQREVPGFVSVLRQVRDHLGATMIVVSHDVPMMVDIADRVYVLDAGSVIAEERPEGLHENPLVVAAYLGASEPEVSHEAARRAVAVSGARSS
jgi:ABC-type branched-subunit amino acid transport system ATPase component/branched-subunit amino acid ABC-type transport system permease component